MKNYACPFCKKDFGERAKSLDEARLRYGIFMARLETLVEHMTKCRKELNDKKEGSQPN